VKCFSQLKILTKENIIIEDTIIIGKKNMITINFVFNGGDMMKTDLEIEIIVENFMDESFYKKRYFYELIDVTHNLYEDDILTEEECEIANNSKYLQESLNSYLDFYESAIRKYVFKNFGYEYQGRL
jgi:hypothetical protein